MLIKGVIKDNISVLTLENLKEQREKFEKELPKKVKDVEGLMKKYIVKCDI